MTQTALALLVALSGGPAACVATEPLVASLPILAGRLITAPSASEGRLAMDPAQILFAGGHDILALVAPRNAVGSHLSREVPPADPAPVPVVPLPAPFWLLASGLAAMWAVRRAA